MAGGGRGDVDKPIGMVTELLSGVDIICLALRVWDSAWKNSQQVMSLLARSNRVLYVGPSRSFRESVRSLRAGAANSQILERVTSGLFVYREPWFLSRFRPTRRGSGFLNLTTQIARIAQVRRVCRQLGFKSPILWVYDPMLAHVVGTFNEKLVVYHVIDNYDEDPSLGRTRLSALVARNQRSMLERADVVFTVSEALYRRCLEVNPNSHLVPNGVNYPLFAQAMQSNHLPDDVAWIPRPIVGYVGVIQSTVDLHLLAQLAARRPDWSLVLVGPTVYPDGGEEFSTLTRRPNVHYLGPKPVEQIPFYIKACDVGLLPYKHDKFTLYGDSLKLYEYLACGRPIVSSNMPFSRRFVPLVHIVEGLSGFIDGIETALAENGTKQAERMAVAEQNSWDGRVEMMREIVAAALARVGG